MLIKFISFETCLKLWKVHLICVTTITYLSSKSQDEQTTLRAGFEPETSELLTRYRTVDPQNVVLQTVRNYKF